MASLDELGFATSLQTVISDLSEVIARGRELQSSWFDNGFSATITDADVASLGIVAADIPGGITVLTQLANFNDNQAVAQADYGSNISKLRVQ